MISENRNPLFPRRTLLLLSLCTLLLIFSACASTPDRFYIPKGIPIKSGTVLNPAFKVHRFVDIENVQSVEWVSVGTETHQWLANLNRWTHTAANLLKDELHHRGITATLGSATVFELIVCHDGESGIKGYLWTDVKNGGCPLDTDRDGVPDLLDRCAGTASDIRVNRYGCPIDTDGDGSPDYRDNCPGKPVKKETPTKGSAPRQTDKGASFSGTFSRECPVNERIFSIAGPIPPDEAFRVIRDELEKNHISLLNSGQNFFTFSTSHEQWKETVHLLELALGKRGAKVIDGPPRIFRLSITRVELFWTFYDVGCRLNLAVLTDDGRLKNYPVSTLAPELYVSCDEAVSKAVSRMFMKERIIVDTDIDLIPDERDECPGTPKGVTVDKLGCPVDTDRDGVPDYMDDCESTPPGVAVDAAGCPLDTDQDGVQDYRDQCAETPEGVVVDGQGCPLDTDGDGVPDYRDECPDTEEGVAVNNKGCRIKPKNRYVLIPDFDGAVGQIEVTSEKGSQILDKAFEATGLNRHNEVPSTPKVMDEDEVRRIFKDALDAQPTPPVHFLLYFVTDTTDLTRKSQDQLPQVLRTIQDRHSVDLMISGHTDRAGSRDHNNRLSLERAQKVAQLLISRGVDPNIIEITSHGEGNPLVKTPDGKAEPRNRRVEIVVR